MSYISTLPISSYTWGNIPASYPTGQPVFVSNAGSKGGLLLYDGSRWRPTNNQLVLATLAANSSNIANSETVVFRYQIPAALLAAGDIIRFAGTLTKSGTTDTGTLRFRMGTAGTTADTQLQSHNTLSAANVLSGQTTDFSVVSSTAIRQQAQSGTASNFGYSGSVAAAGPGDITITSLAGNAIYFSVGILSSSTNDTVSLLGGASIIWIAGT